MYRSARFLSKVARLFFSLPFSFEHTIDHRPVKLINSSVRVDRSTILRNFGGITGWNYPSRGPSFVCGKEGERGATDGEMEKAFDSRHRKIPFPLETRATGEGVAALALVDEGARRNRDSRAAEISSRARARAITTVRVERARLLLNADSGRSYAHKRARERGRAGRRFAAR